MDLTDRVRRLGAARPHVLLVAALGGTASRLAVEAEIARRGWPTAPGPADADLLVVAGEPGGEMAAVLDGIWAQTPLPRARIVVRDPATARDSLDTAARRLAGRDQRGGEHADNVWPPGSRDRAKSTGGGSAARPGASGETAAAAQHDGHDGHDGGMPLPGGLAMADLGGDRDGLMLDRLHVSFGPVLPDWPHGLVVDTVLQGDVLQQARLRLLDPAPRVGASFWGPPGGRDPVRDLARRLDGLARFLGVAGWPAAAAAARVLRDDALCGAPAAALGRRVQSLVDQVRRSRSLRRMLRGVRGGDVELSDLVFGNLEMLHGAAAARAEGGVVAEQAAGPDGSPGEVLERLAGRLVGAEFAAARLIVAAVDPDPDAIVADPARPVRAGGRSDDEAERPGG